MEEGDKEEDRSFEDVFRAFIKGAPNDPGERALYEIESVKMDIGFLEERAKNLSNELHAVRAAASSLRRKIKALSNISLLGSIAMVGLIGHSVRQSEGFWWALASMALFGWIAYDLHKDLDKE